MGTEPLPIADPNGAQSSKPVTACTDAPLCETDQKGAPDSPQKRERWIQENRQAIHHYNDRIAVHGTFADGELSFGSSQSSSP